MFEKIKNKVIDKEDLSALKQKHPKKKIVFCSGCFDILQSGHAVFFNQCKEYGDLLVVGVGRDSTLEQLKGPGRPVNPEQNRVHLIAAMEDVDFAVLNDKEIGEGKIDFKNVLVKLKPDIFIINDDDSAVNEKKSLCDSLGIKIQEVTRMVPEELTPTSTTRIINKINYALRAPLRIDFAGGWTDVPFIMDGMTGYVSNVAIKPLIEYKTGEFNFSGYPRGSGLSTSTAAKLLQMLNSKNYNSEAKNLTQIAEDLFNLENKELQWFIGRQDQYSIVYGGFSCFEFGRDYARQIEVEVSEESLRNFRRKLLMIHSGVSRNAQTAVEEVYQNYSKPSGKAAIKKLAEYGKAFAFSLAKGDFEACAKILELNWEAQKLLAPASSNDELDKMYAFAKENGAIGGKLCGAGGGGAFIFYCEDPESLQKKMKLEFSGCFEINFDFEYRNIKQLNKI